LYSLHLYSLHLYSPHLSSLHMPQARIKGGLRLRPRPDDGHLITARRELHDDDICVFNPHAGVHCVEVGGCRVEGAGMKGYQAIGAS